MYIGNFMLCPEFIVKVNMFLIEQNKNGEFMNDRII